MGTPSPDLQLLLNLFLLVPILIALRFIVRSAAGVRLLMTIIGALLLLIIAPRFLLFYMIYWVVIFVLQFMMRQSPTQRYPKSTTSIALLIAISPLLIWKFSPISSIDWFSLSFNAFVWNIWPLFGPVDSLFQFVEPIGMSFAIFRAIDLLVKVRVGILGSLSVGRIFYYGFFPAILAVGPISEYEEIRIEERSQPPKAGDLMVGLMRLSLGGLKLFIIAPILAPSIVVLTDFKALPVGTIWFGLFVYSWWFYINFSSFSDLSIGTARLMGFKLKENFNNPYFSSSPQKFWANWHMSLTRFAQRNVYILVGGFRKETQYVAIFATMMIIALWHSPDFALLIFGTYHGTIMVVERMLEVRARRLKRKLSDAWPIVVLKIGATFFLVMISIPILVLKHDKIWSFYAALLSL